MSCIRVGFRTLAVGIVFALLTSSAAGVGSRLPEAIDNSERFTLSGNTLPVVAQEIARDQGSLVGDHALPRLSLHFALTASQQTDLNQLLHTLQDRRSPQYHHFLTTEQYSSRFGMAASDVAKVTRWLEGSGFSNVQLAHSGTWISFTGTAERVEAAFHTPMHRFSLRGESYFANTKDPQLPKAFEGVVESVRGLHNFPLHSHLRHLQPHYTINSGNYLAPADWATIYDVNPLYGAGIDGTGVTIAVVGQSDVRMTDIEAFRAAAGLPANNPTVVIPPGDHDPGLQSATGDQAESDLDLEWAGAIAKKASILFITASPTLDNGVQDAIQYAIDNNVAPIISTSYGICESDEPAADFNAETQLYQQANAQGMTIVASSGDSGATDCDTSSTETAATHGLSVDFPASSPYVTGIGGTEFSEGGGNYWNGTNGAGGGSALSYIPENVWNDGFQFATGGGASVLVAKPSWQSGPGVPADSARDVPDLAFAASPGHDGYLICGAGSCSNGFLNATGEPDVIGGTSTGPPTFSGILALTIQLHGSGTRLGNINPNLYSLAQISATVFHDVTFGDNMMPCLAGSTGCGVSGQIGFNAATGYDQTTGWGSADANNFAQQWFGDIEVSASPATVSIQTGTSATATVTVAPHNNFSGNVSFSCSVSGLVGVTCSVPATTVNTSGTTTVTITAADTAHTIPHSKPFVPTSRPPLIQTLPVLLIVLIAMLTALLWGARKRTAHSTRLAFAFSSALIVVVALGAVSCGGGSGSVTTIVPETPPPPTLITSCNFAEAPLGLAYSSGCTSTGGTGAVTYSISSGTLPPGLALNASNGTISGKPTALGSYTFTVEATDSGNPPQNSYQFASGFTVYSPPLQLACGIYNGTVGIPYSSKCTTTGGTGPVSFTVSDGLPNGLVFNTATGAITGTPTTASALLTFYISATDSEAPPVTVQQPEALYIYVAGSTPGLGMNCVITPTNIGLFNNDFCSAYNGVPPFTYSITAGALPPGLTLDPTNGNISGEATALGSYLFTLTVHDSSSPPLTGFVTPTINVGAYGAETGTVTVTATSGGIVNSTTIAVSVR